MVDSKVEACVEEEAEDIPVDAVKKVVHEEILEALVVASDALTADAYPDVHVVGISFLGEEDTSGDESMVLTDDGDDSGTDNEMELTGGHAGKEARPVDDDSAAGGTILGISGK